MLLLLLLRVGYNWIDTWTGSVASASRLQLREVPDVLVERHYSSGCGGCGLEHLPGPPKCDVPHVRIEREPSQ